MILNYYWYYSLDLNVQPVPGDVIVPEIMNLKPLLSRVKVCGFFVPFYTSLPAGFFSEWTFAYEKDYKPVLSGQRNLGNLHA